MPSITGTLMMRRRLGQGDPRRSDDDDSADSGSDTGDDRRGPERRPLGGARQPIRGGRSGIARSTQPGRGPGIGSDDEGNGSGRGRGGRRGRPSADDDDDDDDDDYNTRDRRKRVPASPSHAAGVSSMTSALGMLSPLTRTFRRGAGEADHRSEQGEKERRDSVTAPQGKRSFADDVREKSSRIGRTMKSMMDRRQPPDAQQQQPLPARDRGGGGRGEDSDDDEGDRGVHGGDMSKQDDKDKWNPPPSDARPSSRLQRLLQRAEKDKDSGASGGEGQGSEGGEVKTSRLKKRTMRPRSGATEKLDESGEEQDGAKATHAAASRQKSPVSVDADQKYFRRLPLEQLKARRQLLDRVVADKAPEVHIIGEISFGVGFGTGVCCRWVLEMGRFWSHLEGEAYGQTHTVYTLVEDGETALAIWNHPLDVHLTTSSMQGWPRLILQVYQLDEFGRQSVVGYGFEHVPLLPGPSDVTVSCWRPTGSMQDELAAFFLGVRPQLLDNDVVFAKAWDNRCRLVTLPAGSVRLHLNVILRHFSEQDVDIAKS